MLINQKEVLLLDAGDLFFKKFSSPYPEKELKMLEEKAYLIAGSFNLMGYDAVGIGDDDLSLGKEFLLELKKKTNIPLLSANLYDKISGKLLFQPYLLKEVSGLKIGIFSVLSDETFLGPSDPRKEGLVLRNPIETVREMIKELGSKTDLLILLSHQGYPRDMELAQAISGVDILVGGHTGIDLSNPPVIKNTIILQTLSKGKYAHKFNLSLMNKEAGYYNVATRNSLESNLRKLQLQLSSTKGSEAEKAQWRRASENTERKLQELQGKNVFTNSVFSLTEAIKDHPDIKAMVDAYKSKFPENSEPPIHDSRGIYRPKP